MPRAYIARSEPGAWAPAASRAYGSTALMRQPHPPRRTASQRRSIAIGLALISALLFAGCSFSCSVGADPTVDSNELAGKVEDSYVGQTNIELKSISCEETPAEVGSPINCEATNASD